MRQSDGMQIHNAEECVCASQEMQVSSVAPQALKRVPAWETVLPQSILYHSERADCVCQSVWHKQLSLTIQFLHFDPVFDGAQVIAQMQGACWLHA